MSRQKSPTNIFRIEVDADAERAKERFGDVHRKVGEGWDLLREGRKRTEEAARARAALRSTDSRRASALDNPKAVR